MKKTPLVEISGLNIKSKNQTLIQDQSLEIYSNDITLLVGGSGTGKSVFMRLLAGLINTNTQGLEINGSLKIEGVEQLKNHSIFRKKNPIGIVFQDGGLFDHYNINQNLDFAFSHSPYKTSRSERSEIKSNLLDKLDINPKTSIRSASGGQKRRIAIARTLAYNPDVIIYDEPTAGLDPYTSNQVAQLIKETHKSFEKKSSVIVTHQYDDFLPFVDRILFLDSQKKQIREVTVDEFQEIIKNGLVQSIDFEEDQQTSLEKVQSSAINFLEKTTEWTQLLFQLLISSILRIIPLWKNPIWGLRFLLHYLKLTSFASAIIYIGLASSIIGFVSGYFTFKYLPYSYYTKPLITEEVLAVLGFALFRIVIPLLIALLIAARSGAAVASDVGNRVYLQEVDAIQSLGGSAKTYIHSNIILSYMISVPILTAMGFILAKEVCVATFLYLNPNFNLIWADSVFHMYLRSPELNYLIGADWFLFKQIVSGWGIGNICYFIASKPKSSSSDISKDITSSIIWSTLFVLLTHMVFALFEFNSSTF